MQKADQLWCDARQDAVIFYQRLGFTLEGDTFEKKGVSYVKARVKVADLLQASLMDKVNP
ncbi:hypothetical protein GCM10007094_14780 [Pseudovibrio japonicus]|uniref:N-acetyltransferase domain-containing protein n=1 Tax=Pseudovibrio japonicus TaxID=366534 RepID=A0ABQ3E7K3_9HYPH|nr:GNAT family N-acetyltransferase [Pseudovibrio japonicus]GHB27498.1 hypothetical protein GCM10007094_14780 [Pseudovibrio japonicus]